MRFRKSKKETGAHDPPSDPSKVSGEPEPRGAGWSMTLVIGVALTLIVIVLAVQNTDDAHLEFLGWETDAPLVVFLLASALVGVVFDEIAGLLWRHRRRRQLADSQELAARRAAAATDQEPTPPSPEAPESSSANGDTQ